MHTSYHMKGLVWNLTTRRVWFGIIPREGSGLADSSVHHMKGLVFIIDQCMIIK